MKTDTDNHGTEQRDVPHKRLVGSQLTTAVVMAMALGTATCWNGPLSRKQQKTTGALTQIDVDRIEAARAKRARKKSRRLNFANAEARHEADQDKRKD